MERRFTDISTDGRTEGRPLDSELPIRNPRRPSPIRGGRRFFNELRDTSAGQRRPATPAVAPPVAPLTDA